MFIITFQCQLLYFVNPHSEYEEVITTPIYELASLDLKPNLGGCCTAHPVVYPLFQAGRFNSI